MANICLVDDEKELNQVLKIYIERNGHTVTQYYTMQDALNDAETKKRFDLYVVDIMLLDGSGFEILKQVKSHNKSIPVILISARGDSFDRVLGFDMGCDDYMAKPFLPAELCYRINKQLEPCSSDHMQKDLIQFSCYSLDKSSRTIFFNHAKVEVTSKEYDIVLYFLSHPNMAVSRETLLKEVWGNDYYGYDRVVDNHVKNIRRKFPEFHLETIYGYGYRCCL